MAIIKNVMTCTVLVTLRILMLLTRIKIGSTLEIDNQLMTQDGYFIENTIQGSEPEIPLETFFWTGSGDGPPPLQPPKPISTLNRDVFIKTSTVLATVYIDGQSPMDEDPLCVYNCDSNKRAEDQQLQNSTISYARSDRRFWLLTVVAGFFATSDIPLIEDHLAKLYRMAFARQQASHLGISSESISLNEINIRPINVNKVSRRKRSTSTDEIRPTRTLSNLDLTTNGSQKNELSYPPPRRPIINNAVRVIVHNMTHLTEDDILQRNMDHQVDFINSHGSMPGNQSISNQTEFLYTVFVGNRPVLAVTASEDMKLVSDAEVVKTIGSQVVTKSEPYLKEPLATPLIPATVKQESNIFYYALDNPIMFGILCATILLLVVLLVGFLMMAKTKRQHSAEIRRLTTHQNVQGDPERRPIHKLPTDDLKSGTDNVAFEEDRVDGKHTRVKSKKHKYPPDIEFPLPPLHRPSSSSSGTSDSSVYYNKRYRDEAKNIAKDQHRGDIEFYKKNHPGETDPDDGDRIYAIVAKEKHKKPKKRYIAGNRVGSLEHTKAIVEVISSPSHDTTSDVTYAAPDNYEQIDTFNLREAQKVHERRNLQLKQALFGNSLDDFEIASSVINSPNEAVNREILKALHKNSDQNSADSGSIGSFLSMASIRSFPKCVVPEPLSRVLEPVTITHYDQSDFDDRKIHKPSTSGAYKKQVIDHFMGNDKMMTRQTQVGQFTRTQSDGSDPGIVGPIVWEMHKKEVGKQNSPLRDPAKTRNRFEGLLEGAIRLYETNDNQEKGNTWKPNVSFGSRTPDVRGKSAVITTGRPKMGILRPITAMTTHNDGVSSPPSPSKAWGSGAPSPLVRPLSAGPFHRPPDVDPTRIVTPHTSVQLSTAPLIEAIQNELKKFNRNNTPTT